MSDILMVLSVDTSELEADIERLEAGDLSLPTVSAVRILIDGAHIEQIPIYLEDV
jgi:hypothetical protein